MKEEPLPPAELKQPVDMDPTFDQEVEVSVSKKDGDVLSKRERKFTSSKDIGRIYDHFTLPSESSTLRFRRSVMRVFPNNDNTQFLLEDRIDKDGQEETTMKRIVDSSPGITALRATYTMVAVFLAGVCAVYAITFLLNLITDLTVSAGATSLATIQPMTAVGVFLAFPVCIYGLASGLVLAGSFVSDTWLGSPLLKRYCFSNWTATVFDWSLFVCFLGLPLVVMCIGLLSGIINWWEITLLAWFFSVLLLYIVYILTVTYFETKASWEIVKYLGAENQTVWETLKNSILLAETANLSGYKHNQYLAEGQDISDNDVDRYVFQSQFVESRSLRARLTLLNCLSKMKCYETLEEPKRMPCIQEIQGVRSILTRGTWGLEKVYCRPRNERLVVIIRGPDALTRHQIRSSFLCAIFGQVIGLLIATGLLVYMGAGFRLVMIVMSIALAFWIIPQSFRCLRMYKLVRALAECMDDQELDLEETQNPVFGIRDVHDQSIYGPNEEDSDENEVHDQGNTSVTERSNAIFFVSERFRLTRPTVWFSWTIFTLEFLFLILWPLCSLYQLGNYVIASEFVLFIIFTFFRRFMNPAIALQEVGTIKLADRAEDDGAWRRQARISSILDDVTLNRGRRHWMTVLTFFLVCFLVLCFLAITSDDDGAQLETTTFDREVKDYLPDFEYFPDAQLSYPTCTFGKDLITGLAGGRLIDFAFLSMMAYRKTSIQDQLDMWAGEGNLTDLQLLVDDYRNSTGSVSLPVSYKLFKFVDGPVVVSIRGTSTTLDLFADAQLWSTASFMQLLRFVVPMGSIWTRILDELTYIVSGSLQSYTQSKIAFYKETTAFVRYLQNNGYQEDGILITGHSLGGGIAIITGAQTKLPAISISGPNARLSRRTFDPSISLEDIDLFSLNIIPDRDLIPIIDDVGRLKQNIRCTAEENNFFACHSIPRTLCELMVACGSQGRPPLCKCVQEFGYPEPTPTGNRTFAEACPSLNS